MNWQSGLKGKFRFLEPLKNHTTFKIGGRARYFAEPASKEELRLLLILAKKHRVQVLILGEGSNLLVDDKGVNALVIRLSAPYFKKIIFKSKSVEAGAGMKLAQFIAQTANRGLGCQEFLAGIPGTIGGALMMNAGQAREGRSIADLIDRVRLMDYNGVIKILPRKRIKFGYRKSGLEKYIILSVDFNLVRRNKNKTCGIIKEYLRQRRQNQDLSWPSAGCVFRNPARDSAGRLIELAGLKGKKIGGARISLKHANFIINLRSAKYREVLRLMQAVKREVKNKFKVELIPEIRIWQR